MPLPDYVGLVAGTPITWAASGGDKTFTLTSLANNAAREGAKSGTLVDGTLGMPEVLDVRIESAVGTAATNGLEIEVYFGESPNATAGTDNPGNLTGADAALSNPDELKHQCHYVGSLVLSNARGTNVQKQRHSYYPTLPYIIPLIVNKSGQTLSGTAGNHKLVITPHYRKIID
jgi:hypothetical protein